MKNLKNIHKVKNVAVAHVCGTSLTPLALEPAGSRLGPHAHVLSEPPRAGLGRARRDSAGTCVSHDSSCTRTIRIPLEGTFIDSTRATL